MEDLGTLGGPDAFAFFINESEQVSGQTYTAFTANPVTGLPTTVPFLWELGSMVDLGTLGGTSGFPTAMNNRGDVVGLSNLHDDLTFHPFLWTKRRGMQDLGTLGGATGETNWINDAGYIVGKADLPGAAPQNHAGVLWTRNGAKIDLGVLPGDSCSNAYNVNAAGQVVGTSEDRTHCLALIGERAFLWEDGGPMVDLNTLVPPGSNLTLTYAVGINDRGEIGGFGVPVGVSPDEYETKGHAYILTPCDENQADTDGCESEVDAQESSSKRASDASDVRSGRPTRSHVRPSFTIRPRTHE
jgi:probable HAF family extracellular repeat protein